MRPPPRFCFEAIGPAAADTGALTYLHHFLEHLPTQDRRRMSLLVSRPVPDQLDLTDVEVRSMPAFTASGLGKAVSAQFLLPFVVGRLDVPVVFFSGSIAPAFGVLGGSARVVAHVQNAAALETSMTVADRGRDFYRRFALPAGLRRAAHVITPSATLRSALVARYGIRAERISAIPLGVDTDRFQPPDDGVDPGIDSPYVLFVSVLWRYKNAPSLVSAFARLVREAKIPHRLVLVGKDGGHGQTAAVRALAEREGIADRLVLTGHVSGPRLPALYRHADLFVYPSLVESFGFPLLEAMASGVPVVASNRWAIPEICGDAAVLCHPEVEELAAAMHEVLSSSQLRGELVERGLARAAEFPWERTVRETIGVIDRVALAGA